MLINVDAKALEWVCFVYLSGDEVGKRELNQGLDQHSDNQATLGLPSRHVAKLFLFRTIYADEKRGGAFAFANDPEFAHVSSSERWWQGKIDSFFDKYSGGKRWHADLIQQVGSTGTWTSPTKRTYLFTRKTLQNGDKVFHKPTIYNWPVQGLGADLMSIARVSLYKRLMALGSQPDMNKDSVKDIKLVSTVHDSILIDAPASGVNLVIPIIQSVFNDIPRNFNKLFGVKLDVPVRGEISIGPDWGHMTEV